MSLGLEKSVVYATACMSSGFERTFYIVVFDSDSETLRVEIQHHMHHEVDTDNRVDVAERCSSWNSGTFVCIELINSTSWANPRVTCLQFANVRLVSRSLAGLAIPLCIN